MSDKNPRREIHGKANHADENYGKFNLILFCRLLLGSTGLDPVAALRTTLVFQNMDWDNNNLEDRLKIDVKTLLTFEKWCQWGASGFPPFAYDDVTVPSTDIPRMKENLKKRVHGGSKPLPRHFPYTTKVLRAICRSFGIHPVYLYQKGAPWLPQLYGIMLDTLDQNGFFSRKTESNRSPEETGVLVTSRPRTTRSSEHFNQNFVAGQRIPHADPDKAAWDILKSDAVTVLDDINRIQTRLIEAAKDASIDASNDPRFMKLDLIGLVLNLQQSVTAGRKAPNPVIFVEELLQNANNSITPAYEWAMRDPEFRPLLDRLALWYQLKARGLLPEGNSLSSDATPLGRPGGRSPIFE